MDHSGSLFGDDRSVKNQMGLVKIQVHHPVLLVFEFLWISCITFFSLICAVGVITLSLFHRFVVGLNLYIVSKSVFETVSHSLNVIGTFYSLSLGIFCLGNLECRHASGRAC